MPPSRRKHSSSSGKDRDSSRRKHHSSRSGKSKTRDADALFVANAKTSASATPSYESNVGASSSRNPDEHQTSSRPWSSSHHSESGRSATTWASPPPQRSMRVRFALDSPSSSRHEDIEISASRPPTPPPSSSTRRPSAAALTTTSSNNAGGSTLHTSAPRRSSLRAPNNRAFSAASRSRAPGEQGRHLARITTSQPLRRTYAETYFPLPDGKVLRGRTGEIFSSAWERTPEEIRAEAAEIRVLRRQRAAAVRAQMIASRNHAEATAPGYDPQTLISYSPSLRRAVRQMREECQEGHLLPRHVGRGTIRNYLEEWALRPATTAPTSTPAAPAPAPATTATSSTTSVPSSSSASAPAPVVGKRRRDADEDNLDDHATKRRAIELETRPANSGLFGGFLRAVGSFWSGISTPTPQPVPVFAPTVAFPPQTPPAPSQRTTTAQGTVPDAAAAAAPAAATPAALRFVENRPRSLFLPAVGAQVAIEIPSSRSSVGIDELGLMERALVQLNDELVDFIRDLVIN